MEERYSRTIETLISLNISKIGIILGKCIIPTIISIIFSVIGVLEYMLVINYTRIQFNFNIYYLIPVIIITSFYSSVIGATLSILGKNDSMLLCANVLVFLGCLYLFYPFSGIYMLINFCVALLIQTFILIWISVKNLNNKKIFIKVNKPESRWSIWKSYSKKWFK